MGLLDDAIRDHLELKRRAGADPDEVERIESEALSPARREAPAAAPDPDAVVDYDDDAEDDPLADLPGRAPAPAPEAAADEPPAPAHRDLEPEAIYEHEPEDDAPLREPAQEPQPAPAAHAAPPPAPPAFDEPAEEDPQATQQYSLEELEAQAAREDSGHADTPAEPGEDDVLEGTPEFLQETPEHDRLWFEQKPPKDFDF